MFHSELQAGIAVVAQTKESVARGVDRFQYFLFPIVVGVFVLNRG